MSTENTKKNSKLESLRLTLWPVIQIITLATLVIFLSSCAKMGGEDGLGFTLFPEESIAEQGAPPLPRHLLMDVGIQELDPNYTLDQAKAGEVFPEVRKAEAKYFALRLKNAINETDFWNNVWVVPAAAITDVKVGGKIIESTGQALELRIVAKDASGRELLNKSYSEEATEYDYSGGRKPFENLFAEVAQDLQAVFDKVSHRRINKIKQNADMRFASWIAPEAFSFYTKEQQEAANIPGNDPIYQQAVRLREYDQLFFDRLQDDYDEFYNKVESQHTTWSHESYKELAVRNEAQGDAVTKGLLSGLVMALGIAAVAAGANNNSDAAMIGGGVATAAGAHGIHQAFGEYQRTAIHDDALRELGASLEGDLQPHTLEMEGKAIQLTGSVEEQYLQWHSVLQDQYRLETQADY